MVRAKDFSKNFRGHITGRIGQLIARQHGRIGYHHLLLVTIKNLQGLCRRHVGSIEEDHELGAVKGGKNLCLPVHVILPVQLICGWTLRFAARDIVGEQGDMM
jgi:hypothetical protein